MSSPARRGALTRRIVERTSPKSDTCQCGTAWANAEHHEHVPDAERRDHDDENDAAVRRHIAGSWTHDSVEEPDRRSGPGRALGTAAVLRDDVDGPGRLV